MRAGRIARYGPRLGALLALPALSDGAPVSAQRLIDDLWGEEPPATAGKMVQVYARGRADDAAPGDHGRCPANATRR